LTSFYLDWIARKSARLGGCGGPANRHPAGRTIHTLG